MADKIILLYNGEKITTPYNFEQNKIILIGYVVVFEG